MIGTDRRTVFGPGSANPHISQEWVMRCQDSVRLSVRSFDQDSYANVRSDVVRGAIATMSIQFRKNLAVVTAENLPQFVEWLEQHKRQVFRLKAIRGEAYFQALGREDEACRVPINITSKSPGNLKLISNFAATPFELDRLGYGSIECPTPASRLFGQVPISAGKINVHRFDNNDSANHSSLKLVYSRTWLVRQDRIRS
jgi:hypothetical protein